MLIFKNINSPVDLVKRQRGRVFWFGHVITAGVCFTDAQDRVTLLTARNLQFCTTNTKFKWGFTFIQLYCVQKR